MINLFNQILFRPIFNVLVVIYNLIPGQDLGLAIITLTILIRLVFTPLSIKALRSQKALNKIQPKVKELQNKYKNDKQALGQATMALYRENNINPFSGCLPILIQLPILIALYKALSSGLKPDSLTNIYSFVQNPGLINTLSLGFIDLTVKNPALAVVAGALQFVQTKMSSGLQGDRTPGSGEQVMTAMTKQMLYLFPVMVIIISWNLPTGIVLYWITTTIFSIVEQAYTNRKFNYE